MINIGEIIVKYRKEKNLTQEQLSEVFGVSDAAVSKWETGTAYPDITLLPKIAEFFDISVDRLLGYDMSKAELNIDDCLKKADELLYKFKGKEALAILSNLAYKYPNNVKVLIKYAKAKYQSVHGRPKNEAHRKLFKESEDMLLSINRNGLMRREHDLIMQALWGLYIWDKKFDKVEKILEELKPHDNSFNIDGAEFWFYAHKKDYEKARKKYYQILNKNLLWEPLIHGHYWFYYDEPEKIIDLNNKFIKLIEIFSDELQDNGSPSNLSVLRESNVFAYLRLGRKKEALAEFEKGIDESKQRGESYEGFIESFMKLANSGEREEYKDFKDTPEFKNLTEKLK